MNQKQKKQQNHQKTKHSGVSFTPHAWEDYLFWQETDKAIVEKINTLIKDCQRDPFKGIGQPEPLKHDLAGYWSRRITKEHRLVYLPEDGIIYVVMCCYHYA